MDHETKTIDFGDILVKVCEDLCDLISGRHVPSGVMSGIQGLDAILGGFRAPDLTIVGARTGVGKTALLICWACQSLWRGETVLFFSCEMSAYQVVQRMIIHMAQIPGGIIRGSALLTKAERARHEQSIINLYSRIMETRGFGRLLVHDEGGVRIDRLMNICHHYPAHVIYVDYIQLVRPISDTDRHIQVGEVSMALKKIAMDMNVPVVAAAQLKRLAAKTAPTLNDLRESGSLEQDADQVIFIDREMEDGVLPPRGEARLMVMKNRHGTTGLASVWYEGSTFTFRDLDPQDHVTTQEEENAQCIQSLPL